MAYTYDDFLKDYQNSGIMGQIGQSDLELAKKAPQFGKALLDSMLSERKGTLTGQQLENERNYRNWLRSTVTSGAGTGTGNPGAFVYDRQGEYDAAMNAFLNPEPFTYDPAKDPSMAQYRKQFLREAQRTQQDVLGQMATATGGIPSSYAVTAAQQAGDYYRSQLMDKVPEMQSQAYSRYLNDRTQQANALQALRTDRSNAYTEWANEREYSDAREEQSLEDLRHRADALAAQGDFSLYPQAYGFTAEQVKIFEDAYKQSLFAKVTPQETEATVAFVEKMAGLGLSPEKAAASGMTAEEYRAKIEAYLDQENFTDEELKHLMQVFNLY